MRNLVKLTVCLLLTTVLMIGYLAFPICASTQDTYSSVKYSDIFYVYSSSYLNSAFLKNYSDETFTCADEAYANYVNNIINTSNTSIKDGLKAATDIPDFVKLMKQLITADDYNYDNALDKANEILLTCLTNETLIVENTELAESFFSKVSDYVEWLNDVDEHLHNTKEKESAKNYIKEYLSEYASTFLTYTISKSAAQQLKDKWVNDLDTNAGYLGTLSSIAKKFKAITFALMIEDQRLTIIDELIENTPRNSLLNQGMRRLRSQVEAGSFNHFVENYVSETATDLMYSKLQDVAVDLIPGGKVYSLITAAVSILNWAVFDLGVRAPSVDDLTVQFVLTRYCNDMYFYLQNKIDTFRGQFTSDNVDEFAHLFSAYVTITDAMLEATEDISGWSSDSVSAIKQKYSTVSYSTYIREVKKIISATSDSQRIYADHSDWIISSETYISDSSDYISKNTVYTKNGHFYANLVLNGKQAKIINEYFPPLTIHGSLKLQNADFSLSADMYLYPMKNLEIHGGSFTLNESAYMTVGENLLMTYGELNVSPFAKLTVSGESTVQGYSTVTNHGELVCNGNFTSKYSGGSAGRFKQSFHMAKFTVKGDIRFYSLNYSDITEGTVIFDGETQQTVYALNAFNVKVTNFEGLKYLSDVHVSGHYALLGNPLDDGGYYTVIYNTTTFGDDNYNDLKINTPIVMKTILPGNVYLEGNTASITVTGEGNHFILGSLTAQYGTVTVSPKSCLTIQGQLNATFNSNINVSESGSLIALDTITVQGGGRITNAGEVICYGVFTSKYNGGSYGYFTQNSSNAIFNVKSNVYFSSATHSEITNGYVIFTGTEPQTVHGLRAYNVAVHNPAGISYNSSIDLYGNFSLNSNPIENNGYYTNMYDGATFTDGSDYKRISVKGEVTLRSNVPGELYVIESNAFLIIPTDESYTVTGICTVNRANIKVSKNSTVIFNSDLILTSGGILTNEGKVICERSLRSYYSSSDGGYFKQSSNDALLMLKNGCEFYTTKHSDITGGDVLFISEAEQSVYNLKAYNVTVSVTNGLNYRTNIHVHGEFTIGKSSLKNNGYYTYIYNTTSFGDDSFYENVKIDSTVNLSRDINGNVYTDGATAFIMIPESEEYTIFGDLFLNSSSEIMVLENATLNVMGNILISYNSELFVFDKAQLNVNGNVTMNNGASLSNSGSVCIIGDFKSQYLSSNYGYYNQYSANSVLTLHGEYYFSSAQSHTLVLDGTIIFAGTETQNVTGLCAYNVTVTNTAGVNYRSNNYVDGHFDLQGNPLYCNGYYTYVSDTTTFEPGSDYNNVNVSTSVTMKCDIPADVFITTSQGKLIVNENYVILGKLNVNTGMIELYNGAILTVTEDTTVTYNATLRVNSGTTVYLNGALVISGGATVDNGGTLVCEGDISISYYQSSYGYLRQNSPTAKIYAHKNVNLSSRYYSLITDGTVYLISDQKQNVTALSVYDLTVNNPAGIDYRSDIYVNGRYELNSSPLYNNSYYTYITGTSSLSKGSFYGNIATESTTLNTDIYGNLYLYGSGKRLSVNSGTSFTVYGTCVLSSNDKLIVMDNASFTVHEEMRISGGASVFNKGTIVCRSNFETHYNSGYGYFTQADENAKLYVSGNLQFYSFDSCKIIMGEVIMNGTQRQNANYLSVPTLIIENSSEDGVVFTSAIKISRLFDHKGKNFTLYYNGIDSTFADYDMDGLADDIDVHPTTESDECVCEKVILASPTCTQTGLLGYVCKLCSQIKETEVIARLDHTSGDVDYDLTISNADITVIVRYLSGWDIEVCTICCDIDKNGIINNRDVILVIKEIS